jgi:NRAMP (natural resistance-associated macrophage protein)-like metal ion transporter
MAATPRRSSVSPESPDPLAKTAQRVLPGSHGLAPRRKGRPLDSARAEPRDPLRRWLRILGPGLITGASDDDPSGIGTYSQAGSQFGFGVLWTAIFTFPFMLTVQDTCARIALKTGVGLGTTLRRKFPTSVVGVCVCALLVANTINIGADIEAVAAGGSLLTRGVLHTSWLVVPVTVLLLVMIVRLRYQAIVRVFKYLTFALFAYIVTAVIVHPPAVETLRATIVPHIQLDSGFIGILVAILGTTISPYLFFWQASSEVDELREQAKVSRRGQPIAEMLRRARIDVVTGMALSQIVMYCIILSTAVVLNKAGHTDIQTAAQAADALTPLAGPFASTLFSLGLIGTGLLAIPVLAGSGAYAVKEFFGIRGALDDDVQRAPTLYLILGVAMIAGLALTFAGLDPIKALVFTAVINGLVAPPILALITILARDRKVMGSERSGPGRHSLLWVITGVMALAAVGLVITTAWHA